MDFKKELSKFKEKDFLDETISNINPSNIELIENSLKTEIRKSSLILQNKLDTLQNEISNLNLENEDLKKHLFRNKRELEKTITLLFDSLDIYLPLENILSNSQEKEIIILMKKKLESLLRKNDIEETAKIGDIFNYKYHEILNENLEEKDKYIITSIVSQGYIKNEKIIKIAKVIVS